HPHALRDREEAVASQVRAGARRDPPRTCARAQEAPGRERRGATHRPRDALAPRASRASRRAFARPRQDRPEAQADARLDRERQRQEALARLSRKDRARAESSMADVPSSHLRGSAPAAPGGPQPCLVGSRSGKGEDMSIINRRNAFLGYGVWIALKAYARQQA